MEGTGGVHGPLRSILNENQMCPMQEHTGCGVNEFIIIAMFFLFIVHPGYLCWHELKWGAQPYFTLNGLWPFTCVLIVLSVFVSSFKKAIV